ncbi:unnamed protein product [Nezara viridula]|uniref:Ig-like domain-containing protein n=1 Tax=Nezara viridula TaxID=85310 RepID=A0A9P0HN95_NEZVI|nr:unnamed protein product [Nezara viridula]
MFQAIPKVNYERNSSSLRRLDPFLNRQSEDCLNLNIYAPSSAVKKIIPFPGGLSWERGGGEKEVLLPSEGADCTIPLGSCAALLSNLDQEELTASAEENEDYTC